MTCKITDLYGKINSFQILMNADLPITISISLSKLFKILKDKRDELEPLRKKLWDDSPNPDEGKYSAEFKEFLSTDTELSIDPFIFTKDMITKCEENKVSIPSSVLFSLDGLIEFE